MINRIFLTFGLLSLLLAACASQTVEQSPTQPEAAPFVLEPSATAFLPAQPTSEAGQAVLPAASATPLPVATSRGPDLEATDPRTVSLASGNLQFVEFFRFT